jgi:hypothetical protein
MEAASGPTPLAHDGAGIAGDIAAAPVRHERAAANKPVQIWGPLFDLVVEACVDPDLAQGLLVTEPDGVARFLAKIGELTAVPERSPARGSPYWSACVEDQCFCARATPLSTSCAFR